MLLHNFRLMLYCFNLINFCVVLLTIEINDNIILLIKYGNYITKVKNYINSLFVLQLFL